MLIEAVVIFTQWKLNQMCGPRGAEANDEGPIHIKFAFKVIDPEKIQQEAKKCEIKNNDIDDVKKTGARAAKKDLVPTLYLDKTGDLWREPKKKYCYKIGETSDRHKIIRYLIQNRGYQQTDNISSFLEGKDEQSIRTEIKKIRENIKELLKVDGGKLIESKKGSGYRINPVYKNKVIIV